MKATFNKYTISIGITIGLLIIIGFFGILYLNNEYITATPVYMLPFADENGNRLQPSEQSECRRTPRSTRSSRSCSRTTRTRWPSAIKMPSRASRSCGCTTTRKRQAYEPEWIELKMPDQDRCLFPGRIRHGRQRPDHGRPDGHSIFCRPIDHRSYGQ